MVAGAQAGIPRADFARQTLTQPGSGKTVDLAAAAGVARAHWPDVALIPDNQAAIKKVLARAQAERRPILVTGSFYLLGAVKEWLGLPSLPQNATFG